MGLADLAADPAASLNVARRRRLGLGRALATEPKAILLDENLAGLTPAEVDEALDMLRRVNRRGVGPCNGGARDAGPSWASARR